jgi:replicative DNA helicase
MKTDDKPLPANVPAEMSILGAILLECSCREKEEWHTTWDATAKVLESEDFSLDSHRRIYLRMTELIDEDSQIDIVTLANKLAEEKEIENIGGVAYLAGLTEGLPRRPNIRSYVKIVKAKSLLRKLILSCSSAVNRAYDGGSGFEIIATLKEQINEIEDTAKRGLRTA